MNKNFQEQIEELLLCSICYECVNEPKTLECGHTFCLQCLIKLFVKKKKDGVLGIQCPTCRTVQTNIKEKGDLLTLDAPLYIKQSLNVIRDHHEKLENRADEEYYLQEDSDTSVSTKKLMETCYVCGESGNLQEACSCKVFQMQFENDNDGDRSEPQSAESCEDPEILMITQEFTIGKICKKIFKRKKDESKETPHQVHTTKCHGNWKTSNKSCSKDKEEQQTKYFPKYICHTTAVTGLGMKPKYVPGTLTKTKAVPAMMGQGLYLRQNQNFLTRNSQASRSNARHNTETDPNLMQGQFGSFRKPCFLPGRKPTKIVLKF